MNIQKLTVCHCTDRHGNPLLVLERLPANLCGEGAELYPSTARAFAQALLKAADDKNSEAFVKLRGVKVRNTYYIAAGCQS